MGAVVGEEVPAAEVESEGGGGGVPDDVVVAEEEEVELSEEDIDEIDWGEESPTGKPTQVLQAEQILEEAKEKHMEEEEKLFKEPRELVRRANNAFMWGVPNASVEMYGRAIALASNETDGKGLEIRRTYATQLAVVMYYDDKWSEAAALLTSLVSDLDFENVTAIELQAENVIWLGACHMKANGGELVADEEFELLKSLAVVHLDIFEAWSEPKKCVRAAFQLFMTNNEQALGDLNACIDSDWEDDQLMANCSLALYADARGEAVVVANGVGPKLKPTKPQSSGRKAQ